MKETLIPVFLTEIEAQSFVAFQKHRSLIGLLESIGGFNLANGWIKIHFDDKGMIGVVEKHQDYRY